RACHFATAAEPRSLWINQNQNGIGMLLCLVTDGHRLSTSNSWGVVRRCVLDQIHRARDAGIDLVQIRERDLSASDLRDLVRDALDVCRGSSTRILVNDRLD